MRLIKNFANHKIAVAIVVVLLGVQLSVICHTTIHLKSIV